MDSKYRQPSRADYMRKVRVRTGVHVAVCPSVLLSRGILKAHENHLAEKILNFENARLRRGRAAGSVESRKAPVSYFIFGSSSNSSMIGEVAGAGKRHSFIDFIVSTRPSPEKKPNRTVSLPFPVRLANCSHPPWEVNPKLLCSTSFTTGNALLTKPSASWPATCLKGDQWLNCLSVKAVIVG